MRLSDRDKEGCTERVLAGKPSSSSLRLHHSSSVASSLRKMGGATGWRGGQVPQLDDGNVDPVGVVERSLASKV